MSNRIMELLRTPHLTPTLASQRGQAEQNKETADWIRELKKKNKKKTVLGLTGKYRKAEYGGEIQKFDGGGEVDDKKPPQQAAYINDFRFTDADIDYLNKNTEYCPHGNCLQVAWQAYDKLVASRHSGFPSSWGIKRLDNILSTNKAMYNRATPVQKSFFEAIPYWNPKGGDFSADSGDIHAALMDAGGTNIFNANDAAQVKALETEEGRRALYSKIPIGAIVGWGTAPYAGTYNKTRGLKPNNHSTIVVGYADDGVPILYDYDKYYRMDSRKGKSLTSPKHNFPLTNITVSPQTSKFTKDYLQSNAMYDTHPRDLDLDISGLYKYGDKKQLDEFYQSLKTNKPTILQDLKMSNDEYDKIAKTVLGIAMQETKGGKDKEHRLQSMFKTTFGETQGLTQLNIDNLTDDPEIAKLAKKFDIKFEQSLYDPKRAAIASMLYGYRNMKAAKANYEKGAKAGERKFYPNWRSATYPGMTFNTEEGKKIDIASKATGLAAAMPIIGNAFIANRELKDIQADLDRTAKGKYKATQEGGKVVIVKKTLGNSKDMSDEEKFIYNWQSPYALTSGDAQGESNYYKNIKNFMNLIKTNQMTARAYASGGTVSKAKAAEILRDGTAHGRPLTDKQKRFFGYMANKAAYGGDATRRVRITAMPDEYPTGGNTGMADVEMEGGEAYQTPDGQLTEIPDNQPSHEEQNPQGGNGVPLTVPVGTKVYSDRLMIDGMTMKDRKLKREKEFARLRRAFEKNPTSVPVRNSLARGMSNIQKEEQMDMAMQNRAKDVLAPPTPPPMAKYGGSCFKCGGKVYAYGSQIDDEWDRIGPRMKYPIGGYAGAYPNLPAQFDPFGLGTLGYQFADYATRQAPPAVTANRTGYIGDDGLWHKEEQKTATPITGEVPTFTPTGQNLSTTPRYTNFPANISEAKQNEYKGYYNSEYNKMISGNDPTDTKFMNIIKEKPDYMVDKTTGELDPFYSTLLGGLEEGYGVRNNANMDIKDQPGGVSNYAWKYGLNDKHIDKATGEWVANDPNAIWTPGVSKVPTKTKKPRDPNAYRLTAGDYTGIAGTLFGNIANIVAAKRAAAATLPVINRYRGVGHRALDTMQASQRMVGNKLGEIMRELGTSYNTNMEAARASSPTINTLRAMQATTGYGSDMAKATASSKAYEYMANLMGQEAQTQFRADMTEAGGEERADERKQQNLDNYYSSMAGAYQGLGEGIQTIGRDINVGYANMKNNRMLSQLSEWGLGFDRNGNIIQLNKDEIT